MSAGPFYKMTVNGKTFVTSRHDILGRIKKKRGREYYLSNGKIVEYTKRVVGTWKVHGRFTDRKCTQRCHKE